MATLQSPRDPKQLLKWELGQRIVRRRKRLGYTQAELAERAGIHEKYLGRIECGRPNITVVMLANIARALKTDSGNLVRGLGMPSPHELPPR